jgi:hypothetical protein
MFSGLSTVAFAAFPPYITVDSDSNGCEEYNLCAGGASVLSEFFEAGTYQFTVYSGESLSGTVPNGGSVFPPEYFWGINIYQPGTSTEYVLGDYAPQGTTPGGALSANLGKSITISQPSDGNLLFYVRDDNPRDNVGTMTVAVAPEPVSSMLFLSGGAVFAGRRFWKKKK